MDNTETYIKMCDCPEIQGQWIPRSGDFIKLRGCGFVDVASGKYGKVREVGDIGIPRQDQLQAMISPDWKKVLAFEFAYAKNFDMSNVETKEQLDLMIYMREKFGKTWDGEKWN